MSFNIDKALQAEKDFVKDKSERNRNKMIMHHTGLVRMIAKNYVNFVSDHDFEDLLQEGMLGLMVASEKFDPSKNVRFSTYASWWVRSRIQISITDSRATYFNTTKIKAFGRKSAEEREKEENKDPLLFPVSLNAKINRKNNAGSNLEFQDVIADGSIDIEKYTITTEQIQLLHLIAEPFLCKSKHRRHIFKERLISDEPKTLAEIGKEIGLSREGVRFHEKALLKDLREAYGEYKQN